MENQEEKPFNAQEFVEKMDKHVAEERSTFYERTISPKGDKDKFVNIMRSIVGENNQRHEPYLTMFQKVIEAYDAELKRADDATEQLGKQDNELDFLRFVFKSLPFDTHYVDVLDNLKAKYIETKGRYFPAGY